MAESKKYTLTRKGSVTGPVDNPYNYSRGDVISQAEYNKLVPRHKDQFEEGIKELNKVGTAADKAQNQRLADLEARVSALEGNAAGPETEDGEPAKKADSKKSDKK